MRRKKPVEALPASSTTAGWVDDRGGKKAGGGAPV